MAFWDKAKRFLTDIFYEKDISDIQVDNKNEENTSKIVSDVSDALLSKNESLLKEKNTLEVFNGQDLTVSKGVLSDFFVGHDIVVNNLQPVSEEVQYYEALRVKAMSHEIAKANGLKESAVWTELGGNTRIRKNLADVESADIVVNASFTSKLNDDQLAFVIGRQYARILCRHDEEEKLLSTCFENSDSTQYYRFRVNAAVHRKNIFEEDKYGLEFANKAGYHTPKDLDFLRMDESIFGIRSNQYSVLAYEPNITERQIILDSYGADVKPFDKKEFDDYVDKISKAVTERDEYLCKAKVSNGVYVGLSPEEYLRAVDTGAEVEELFINRFMPSLKEQNSKIKEWVAVHIPTICALSPEPLEFKPIRNLHFSMDIVKNTPARLAFEKEVMNMLSSVRRCVNVTKNLDNISFRFDGKAKKSLRQNLNFIDKIKSIGDNDNSGR